MKALMVALALVALSACTPRSHVLPHCECGIHPIPVATVTPGVSK